MLFPHSSNILTAAEFKPPCCNQCMLLAHRTPKKACFYITLIIPKDPRAP